MPNTFVYPPRNLPGTADVWGRSVEQRANVQDKSFTQLEQRTDNALRATAGQLAVIAQQVADLSNRRSHVTSVSNISQTNNVTTDPTFTSQTFTLPAPNVARSATIGITGSLSNSGGTANPVRAFVQVSYLGTPQARGDYAVPQVLSVPSNWAETPNLIFLTSVPAGADPVFTLSISRLGFSSTSTTLTFSGISAFIQYGDPV